MHKRLNLRQLQKMTLLVCAMAIMAVRAVAQTPAFAYNPSTTVADAVPWGNNSVLGAQYIFTPSDLTPGTPTSGGLISAIYVKPGNTASTGGTFSDLQVSMGTTTSNSFTANTWLGGLTAYYFNSSATIASWTSNS